MSEQQITIDRHTYRGGGIEIDHEGTCTWENCGRPTDCDGPDQTIITHPTTFEAMAADFGPSYGGVALTRRGQQVVCKTGDEVIAALQDAAVVYREDVAVPPPHEGA